MSSLFGRMSDRLRRRSVTPGQHQADRAVASPAAVPGPGRDVLLGKHRLPDWAPLLAERSDLWSAARARAADGPRVLIATNVAGHSPATVVESVLAVALTLRGAQVETLICDAVMPACLRAQHDNVGDPGVFARYDLPNTLCGGCQPVGEFVYGALGLPVHRYSELLSAEARVEARRLAGELDPEQIRTFCRDGQSIGEHAYAGALRYFARGDLVGEPHGEVVLRRYFEASLQTAAVVGRLVAGRRFDVACLHHGIYVPQGIASEVARAAGLRVVTWNPAYRTSCFIFSHDDTYHHTLLAEPAADWEALAWTPEREGEILDYLASREAGPRDWIWYHDRPDADVRAYARDVGLDLGKPIVGLLSNVVWDAQLHYRANAFSSMLDWTMETIRYFAGRPDLQLLIRVHPAELRGTVRSRQRLVDEIRRVFPALPPNVFVIPPESQLSTYAAMARANAVIIYGTKTGVELTSAGIPTIVAGEAWIRNKGLTHDAGSPAEYVAILDRLPFPSRMDAARVSRARRYAYHFFFRRMIPLPILAATDGWPPFRVAIESIEELLPGRQPGLDVICDGLLAGRPFIYPAETLGLHDA